MATVLITGTSSGIGLSTALELARAGHSVIATMRNPAASPELAEIAAREGLPLQVRTLDVDDDESVRACVAAVDGPIDVLVNNAGVECHGSIEEMPMDRIIGTMNTNYFGAVRCIKAVLPRMREARSGCIINISSVAGRISNPPLGAYAASKFALEAMSEALAGEVKPFNIRVAIVEPGIQDTKMARTIEHEVTSIYPQVVRFSGLFRAALANPVPPVVTAQVVRQIIESGTWQFRHTSGPDAAAFLAWRANMTDEQWIAWSAQDDESWYEQLERDFGMNARPQAPHAGVAAVEPAVGG
ncbi:short-chain dehydrogenase/reductase [Luteitalea sp. TBR-22]|uniref:SDR family oxidoreductase n=1 Tax=Luteitalea sp. TBR-22 TaxID=2802971 RepID=UPI001AF6774F|nr:SDR family oxidoreductase [Luteitalea sp. TBR-22]BCS34980.1 short-chain dehydrogenase/reductase [Luteitalea sp. TBR-22]